MFWRTKKLQQIDQVIGGKTHLDGEQMEDVAKPHGTTPDRVANEHWRASVIRYNEQEMLATILQKKREAAAAHKSHIDSEEQQTSPRNEEPIAPVKVTTILVKV